MLRRYAIALIDNEGTYFFKNTKTISGTNQDSYELIVKGVPGATVDVKVVSYTKSGTGHFKMDGTTYTLNQVHTITLNGSGYQTILVQVNGGTNSGQFVDATVQITRVVSTPNTIGFPKTMRYVKQIP